MEFKTKHLWKVLRILTKADVLEDIKELIWEANNLKMDPELSKKERLEVFETAQEKAGIDLAFILLAGLETVEKETYELLADLKSVTIEDIENQSMTETISDFKQILAIEELKGFLQQAVA